jgi:hypothetical protein
MQKKLLKSEDVKVRKNLKKKVIPFVQDPALIPMNIYFLIIQYETNLFKMFLTLARGLRKHLLFYIFETYINPISNSFKKQYLTHGLELEKSYISMSPISFCRE